MSGNVKNLEFFIEKFESLIAKLRLNALKSIKEKKAILRKELEKNRIKNIPDRALDKIFTQRKMSTNQGSMLLYIAYRYPGCDIKELIKEIKSVLNIDFTVEGIRTRANRLGVKRLPHSEILKLKSTQRYVPQKVLVKVEEIKAENENFDLLMGLVQKVKDKIDRGPTTVAELSREFDISKKTVMRILDVLKFWYKEEEGFLLNLPERIRGRVEKLSPSAVKPIEEFPGYDTTFRFLVLSNLWLGNKFQQVTLLHTIMKEAERMGVKFCIVVGGLVAAKPARGTQGELFLHEAELLADYVCDIWPKTSFNTYILAGDEELSWKVNMAELICSDPKRNDLRYLGSWSATAKISGTDVSIRLVYPRGGVKRTYTISYRPQKAARAIVAAVFPKVRSLGIKDMPRLIFNGRVLAQGEINRGVKTVLCPGLVDQTPSLTAAEVMPSIGAMIVELKFDKKGRLVPDFDARGNPKEGGYLINYYDFSPYVLENDYGEFPNCDNCNPLEQQVLDILRKESATIGEISRRLDKSQETIFSIIKSLEDKGFKVKISESTQRVIWEPDLKKNFRPLEIKLSDTFIWGTTSDIHFGSKYQQPSLLRMVHRYAEEVWGAQVLMNAGDNFDGRYVYRGQEAEVFAPLLDNQLKVAVEEWPKKPKTIAIGGNHDESFWKNIIRDLAKHYNLEERPEVTEFADIMRELSKRRPEIQYLGMARIGEFCTEAKVAIDIHGNIIENNEEKGLVFLLLHPRGSVGQFRSYRGQKFLENLLENILSSIFNNRDNLKEFPHIYLMGNWHVNAYLRYGGVDIFLLPALQDQTRFMKELGLTPDIGAWMVKSVTDRDKHILLTTIKYLDLIPYKKEKDY